MTHLEKKKSFLAGLTSGDWIQVGLVLFAITASLLAMKSDLASAEEDIVGNNATLKEIVGVIKKQNDRQIAVERKQAILEYKVEQDTTVNEKQSRQLAHQTKELERIAAKLQVRTDD